MKILNLFAGIGGNRTLWNGHEITSVEFNPVVVKIYRKRFPLDRILVQDVFDFLRDKNNNLNDYDFIWASPPCQSHSQMQKFNPSKITRPPIPDLTAVYGLKFWLQQNYSNFYVIENVQPYYKVPIKPTVKLGRHLFWSNFSILPKIFPHKFLGTNKHGKIGGVMREDYNHQIEKMMLIDIKKELAESFKGKKLRTVVRNCVDPKIGKYILRQVHTPELLSYLEMAQNEA